MENELDEDVLTSLRELFVKIGSQKKKTGVLAPRRFITNVKKDNGALLACFQTSLMTVEFFRSPMHHDAHEFLNFLLNALSEIVTKKDAERPRQVVVGEGRRSISECCRCS